MEYTVDKCGGCRLAAIELLNDERPDSNAAPAQPTRQRFSVLAIDRTVLIVIPVLELHGLWPYRRKISQYTMLDSGGVVGFAGDASNEQHIYINGRLEIYIYIYNINNRYIPFLPAKRLLLSWRHKTQVPPRPVTEMNVSRAPPMVVQDKRHWYRYSSHFSPPLLV